MREATRLIAATSTPPIIKLTPEEADRWARMHIESDKRKPLPDWWGKRR